MTAAKHTPGPWRAEEWSCHARTTVLVDDASIITGKRVIAECESEEDARLIAASPDLLAVLIELTDIEGPLPGDQAWHAKALAAIAKATGN